MPQNIYQKNNTKDNSQRLLKLSQKGINPLFASAVSHLAVVDSLCSSVGRVQSRLVARLGLSVLRV